MLEIKELTNLDYKILRYIGKYKKIKLEDVINHFSNKISAVELRINILSTADRKSCGYNDSMPINNTYYICNEYTDSKGAYGQTYQVETGYIYLSELGKIAIQEITIEKRTQKVAIIKNWLPIAISIIALVKASWIDILWLLDKAMQLLKQ